MTRHFLSTDEITRYARHLSLSEIGESGQETLKNTSVLVIGVGGLGSPLALYLAAAGIGKLTLVDFDKIDASNLQRQILYRTDEVGQKKVACAKERLLALNPHISVDILAERFSLDNAARLVSEHTIVADGADNFPTRFLVNDACVFAGKPLISASLLGFEGQLSVFNYQGGPCYRCLYAEPPPAGAVPSCAEGGVLGALCGVMGSLQAVEVVKVALSHGSLSGHLLHVDAWGTNIQKFRIRKNATCPVCGPNPQIRTLQETVAQCGLPSPEISEIFASELARRLREFTLLDVRDEAEVKLSRLEGAIWIPLPDLKSRLGEVASDREIVVFCRAGIRGRTAAAVLMQAGYRVHNLAGGVLAWAREIDTKFVVG